MQTPKQGRQCITQSHMKDMKTLTSNKRTQCREACAHKDNETYTKRRKRNTAPNKNNMQALNNEEHEEPHQR